MPSDTNAWREQWDQEVKQTEPETIQAEERTQLTTLKEKELPDICHKPSQPIIVESDKPLDNQGSVTSPKNEICPTNLQQRFHYTRIQQAELDKVYKVPHPPYQTTHRLFKSLSYVEVPESNQKVTRKIASAEDLRRTHRLVIEDSVPEIISKLATTTQYNRHLDLGQGVNFENHPNRLRGSSEDVSTRSESPTSSKRPRLSKAVSANRTDEINKDSAEPSYTSDSDDICPSHAATSDEISVIHPENSDENAIVEDVNCETSISAGSVEDDNMCYVKFEAFVTALLVKALDLPSPESVCLIRKGGFHYPFAIEYPAPFWVRNDGRCRSEPPIKRVLLPAKMVLRIPIYEMDIASRSNAESSASKTTLSELKDRAARNLFAGIDSNGLKGPKIFAYDCECAVPYMLMECVPGKDLETELFDLNSEDICAVSKMWAIDAQVYQNIIFDGPGSVVAHSDLPTRDWPCFLTEAPRTVIQVEPTITDSQKISSDHLSQLFFQQLTNKLDASEKKLRAPEWGYYGKWLKMLYEVLDWLKISCLRSEFCLYNQDPEPRNIMIERSVNGKIQAFRRVDFDDLGTVPSPCGIRSAWPTLSRYSTFSLKWSDDEKADFAQKALDLVLYQSPQMDRASVKFNDFLFGYFCVIEMDLREEVAFYLLEDLDEEWSTHWVESYEAGFVLYARYRGSTPGSLVTRIDASEEDHPRIIDIDDLIDWAFRTATNDRNVNLDDLINWVSRTATHHHTNQRQASLQQGLAWQSKDIS